MKAGQSVTPVSYLDLVGFGILWGGGAWGTERDAHCKNKWKCWLIWPSKEFGAQTLDYFKSSLEKEITKYQIKADQSSFYVFIIPYMTTCCVCLLVQGVLGTCKYTVGD